MHPFTNAATSLFAASTRAACAFRALYPRKFDCTVVAAPTVSSRIVTKFRRALCPRYFVCSLTAATCRSFRAFPASFRAT